MKTETKELKLRLELELDRMLTEAAKKAGIPKTKLAMQLLTQGLDPQVQISGVTSDRIVGAKAKVILVENADKTRWLKEDYQVIWFDGFIWFIGKTANGSQVQLERWLEYPETLFSGLDSRRPWANSAAEVKEALARWDGLKGMAYIDMVPSPYTNGWFGDGFDFFSSRAYKDLEQKAIQAITAYKLSLAAPTADVEPVIDEVVADAVGVAPIPTVEDVAAQLELPPVEETRPTLEQPSTTLTKKEFKALYQINDEAFSKLGNKLKTGVTMSDGRTWFKLSQSRVTTETPQVSTTQLALVLV